MDSPKSRKELQQSDEGTSSIILASQARQRVPMMNISKYQGVKPLQNGEWGAHIFVNHHCLFLRKFRSEIAAARAHDSAGLIYFKDDFIRNFLLTDITIHEPLFQNLFSKKAILKMILDCSYEPKFVDFVRNILRPNYSVESGSIALPSASDFIDGVFIREMFHKELTSSDVGEQNMLMLPSNQAMRFFPIMLPDKVESLEFKDKMNRSWVFRLDYLNNIQSHVFTTGWNNFVNVMELRAKDFVVLYRCKESGGCFEKSFDMIDVIRGFKSNDDIKADESNDNAKDIEWSAGSDKREEPNEFSEKGEKSNNQSNPPKRSYPMDPPKSRAKLQRSGEGPSSIIPSTQARQWVLMPAISKYKGVRPLEKGDWGAQIFVYHHYISLGTFKFEIAAARAHDSAGMKFLENDFNRNFLLTDITIHEPLFQNLFSNEAILEMISDGSYEPKFIDFFRKILQPHCSIESGTIALPSGSDFIDGVFIREMFHKELTSSDVGEQNKLMLPSNQAMRFFPVVLPDKVESLKFKDKMNRSWVFRLEYLNNIHHHVLTTGWNNFVNVMELRAKDFVVLYRCKESGGSSEKSFDMIDVIHGFKSNGNIKADESEDNAKDIERFTDKREEATAFNEKEEKSKEEKEVNESEKQPKLKLFGRWIG